MKLFIFVMLSFSSAVLAQNLTPIANPNDPGAETVTVCDMKMKSEKKAVKFCATYDLGVERDEQQLFQCDCSHFAIVGPRGP